MFLYVVVPRNHIHVILCILCVLLFRYLGSYPQMAMMMENIIRVYGLLYGGLTGDTVEEEQEIIDMVERNFEDDLEDADQENVSSPLAQAQEQVSYMASN